MRKRITVLFLSVLTACMAVGCGKKKEEPKDTAEAGVTVTEAPETQVPKETVPENETETDSGAEKVSKNQAKKKTKKKKDKKKAQVTPEGSQETPDASAQEEQARAQAQAEAQARAEEERLAAEAEAARLAEEEAQRQAAEAAITDQDIPQDTAAGSAPQADAKEIAQSYVGRTMDELIGAIGQPQGEAGRDVSCQGDGSCYDIYYNYPGFVVSTYEDNGYETVMGVQ